MPVQVHVVCADEEDILSIYIDGELRDDLKIDATQENVERLFALIAENGPAIYEADFYADLDDEDDEDDFDDDEE